MRRARGNSEKLPKVCGKRAAGEVSGVTASSAEIRATPPGTAAEQISAEPGNDTDQESRWWLQVAISNFRLRALYDTGASRTVMGAVGLQLASALGRPVMPSYGRRAKVVGGQTATIAGYVELPFEVAGVKRDIRVAVIPDDKVDCYLGANFVRAFGTIHDPINNQLILSAAEKRVHLEVAAVSSVEALEVSAIGLEDVSEGQRQEMAEFVGRILSEEDQALGCTTWARHHIDVGSARPVKQRYYPVSKKIEEDMHRQVIEMLESGVIEPSTSAWLSPVVMIRKSNDKYRFCLDFRKLNAV